VEAFRGEEMAFDIVARDASTCSELQLMSTSLPSGANFSAAEDVSEAYGGTSMRRRFTFPSPNGGAALLDTRPPLSVAWPARHYSPRHRMSFNSRIEGSKCVKRSGKL
jgi:hypothetical protein